MRVDVIDSLDALARLKGNWDAVYQADPEAQFYMSWTWISGWFRRLGSQWLVLAAKNTSDGGYVGFFPLQLRTERGRDGAFHNELRIGGGYSTGYNGLICDPRLESGVLQAFAGHIQTMNWAKLHLDNIFLSPARLEMFLNQFSSSDFNLTKVIRPDDGDGIDHDVYVYAPLPKDWEAFLGERMGAKTRANARRTLRQVDDSQEYRITHVTAETLDLDLGTLLRFWEIQWADKLATRYHPGLPQGMMKSFREMLAYCFQYDALFLPVLWQGENPIGVQASLIDRKNGSLISLLNGRDLSVKRPPPGFALHLYSVRWAIQNGFQTYDLQTGDFSYKYDFGGIERRIECLLVNTASRRNLRDRLEPRSLPVVFARANALHRAGDLKGAAYACRQILEVDPHHAGAAQALRQIDDARRSLLPQNLSTAARLHQAGNLAGAEPIYREILEVEPQRFDVRYLFGALLLQQRRYDEAEREIGQAIKIKPDIPAAHYNRGVALAKLDRIEDALADLDNCLALEPNHSQALALRADLSGTLGRMVNAAE